MADETLQQQPPTFSDELYKYAHDSGFIPKEATVDIFKKNLSNKDFVKELYDYSVQTEFIPKEATIDIFTKNIGGVEPSKKKDVTEKPDTVSPAGGGSSGLLSVKFGGDQYEVNPKTQEVFMGGKPVTVPQNIKDYIAKNMLGVELPKQTGATDSAGVPMGESIQSPIKPTGADIPSTLGDKAAKITEKKMRLGAGGVDEIKVEFTPQQQAKIESFGLNPDQFRNSPLNEDFEKLAKQFDPNINVSDEKAVDKFLDDYRVFSNINAADNLAKQVGVSRKAMSDYMNDLTAEVFIDKPDQKAIYEIDKLFNEAVTKGATPQELDKLKQDRQKAVDFVVNNTNLDVIALRKEIDKKKLDGQDYSAEQKELNSKLSQYNSFVKPAGKVLEQVLKGEPSYNLLDEKFKGKSEKERLRLVYDGMRTELYTIGKKLGFSLEDMKSGKVDIPTYFGFGEDGKRYVELYGKVRDLAPVVLINQSPDEKQDDFLTTFSNSFFGAISPAAAVNTKTEQQTGSDIKTFADLARVQPSDVAAENLNKKLEDYGFGGAFWGQTLGGSLGVGVSIFAGSKGMNLLTGALKAGRFTAPLADFLTTTKGGKAILSGGAYELGGEILPASSGEANFGTGLIGEIATYLPSPVKGLAPALTKLFGDSAEKAAKYIGNAFKRGIAETGQETAQSLYQIYSDTPAGKSVFDNIKQQFGEPSDMLKFAISTFIMGAAMGGGADLGLHQSNVDAVNQLSPEDRAIYDSFTGEQRAKANTDILNIAKEQAPLVPTDNLQNQADNTAEAIDKLKNLPLKPIDNPDQSYSVEVDGIKYEGNSQEDLQSDIEYLTELNGIVNNELYNRNSGQTETPTDTEQVQQQPIAEEGVGVEGAVTEAGQSDTANLPQDVQDKIAKLRADEQADLAAAIPNIDEYKVDGVIDKKKIENSPDGAAYKKIYDQYNAPITALFEQGKKEGVTEPIQAPVIKAQVMGTTAGFNTIIDGGLGEQKDPRTAFTSSERSPVFETQPNNNESSLLDISLPSTDAFGRQGGIQIRFELPNGVDANTVFEEVVVGAALAGRLDAKDPDFQQKVQGLVDRGIAKIQGLATGGAKQTAQVKETVEDTQVAEPANLEEGNIATPEEYDELEKFYKDEERKASSEYPTLSYKEEFIHQNIGRVDKQQLIDGVGEKVFKDGKMGSRYTKNGAQGIDQRAQEMSEMSGVEITPQDIFDYFLDRTANGGRYVKQKVGNYKAANKIGEAKQKLADSGFEYAANATENVDELLNPEFIESLRGFPLTNEEADAILETIKKANTDENFKNGLKQQLSNVISAEKTRADIVSGKSETKTAPTPKIDEGQAKPISQSPQDVTGNGRENKNAAEKTEGKNNNVNSQNGNKENKSQKPNPTVVQQAKEADTEGDDTVARSKAKRASVKSALKKLRDDGLLKTADKSLIAKAKKMLGVKSAPMSDAEIDAQMALLDAMADVWKNTTGKDNFYETFIGDIRKGDLSELKKMGGALFQDTENPAAPTSRLTLAVFEQPLFEKMKGSMVAPQAISDLVKSRGKQIEKDIINMVLDFDKYKGQKRISFDEFRGDVETQIMKLEKIRTRSYADYGYSNLGDNENYGDTETVIFNSPIEHGQKGHFSGDFTTKGLDKTEWELRQIPNTDNWAAVDKNMPAGVTGENIAGYIGTAGEKAEVEKWISDRNEENDGGINQGLFGHIRKWFNKRDGIFHIAELQSDYYQKNKASDLMKPKVSDDEVNAHMNKNVWQPIDKEVADKIKNDWGITTKKDGDVIFAYDRNGQQIASEIIENPRIGLERGQFEQNNVIIEALEALANRETLDKKLDDGTYQVYTRNGNLIFKTEQEAEQFIKSYDGRFNGAKDAYNATKDSYYEKRRGLGQVEEQKFIQKRQEELAKGKPVNIQLKQFVASQKVHELRLLREAIKMAAEDGAETVRFPSQYTLAVIEGYTDATGEGAAPYEIISGDSDRLYEGDEIDYGGERMIVVEQNRSTITVAPKDEVSVMNYDDLVDSETDNRIDEIEYEAKRFFNDIDAITREEVENYEPDEWMGDSAKTLLEAYFDENEDAETVEWSDISSGLYDMVRDMYGDMQVQDLVSWSSTVWMDGDTIYALEGRNYETFNQPDEYEASSSKEDYYENLSKEQKTVVDKYGELAEQFQKMRPDARTVVDDNGMEWLETTVTEADKNNPIVAFQKEGDKVKGAVDFTNNNKATLHIFDGADITTLAHEMSGHLGRRVLERLAAADPDFAKQYKAVKKWAGVKDVWTTKAEEKFARGFERYLREGKAPTTALKEVFGKLKEWLSGVYKVIKGSSIDIELTDDVRNVFDTLLGKEKTNETGQAKPISQSPQDVTGNIGTDKDAAEKTKGAIPTETIDKLVGKATDRRAAVEAIADENIKEVAKAVTDTKVIDKVMDAIDNNDQLLADLEKKLGMKKICKVF